MAINNKDDYEKLAKILYPSIEASGNVYYGQTRKLTMDEILGKNELNFESHIETFNNASYGYASYFCWNLGSLKGSIKVLPFDSSGKITLKNFPTANRVIHILNNGNVENITNINENLYGTVFAKYMLSIESTPVSNVTNSGSFVSYENNINLDFVDFILTESKDPTNILNYNAFNINNRNFYISKESGNTYLYIQVVSCDGYIKDSHKRYEDLPFTIELLSGSGTVRFLCDDYLYKTNGSWETYSNGAIVNLDNIGDTISYKKNNRQTPISGPVGTFVVSGSCTIKVYGCAYSLLLSNWHNSPYYTNNCFEGLFEGCTQLVDASDLIMPNTEAVEYCCNSMFKDCTGLIYPPQLNSYYLNGEYCYLEMFNGCSSLKYAPQLPAELLTYCCYEYMFGNCSSLEYAPYLPATTLAEDCYHGMFANCTNLKYIQPILPATTISQGCYWAMFSNCQNIKCAPILPARSLANRCYQAMFSDCYSLEEIVCLADDSNVDDILDPHNYVDDWLYNVTSSGLLKLLNNHADFLDSSIPNTWSINTLNNSEVTEISEATIIFPKVGFNCKLSNSSEPDKYYSVITSGSDSDNNGRGKLNNTTTFNMLEINPILSSTIYDECDLNNGNSNQEIWGYKCFNSPVSFRNGIYGECSSLITSNPNCDSLNIRLSDNNDIIDSLEPAYSLGAKFICAVPDDSYLNSPLSQYNPCSTIEIYHSSIKEDHYNNDTDGNYKACVSQAGIIASNKYSDISNSNRYIDINAASGSDYENLHSSAVITSASVCPVANSSTEVVGYSEEYKSSIVAGNAYLKIKYIDSYGGSDSIIELYADEISLDGGVTCYSPVHIDDALDVLGNIYTSASLIAQIVSDEIDPIGKTSEKDCLVLGNTRNNNSGALVINTHYTYNTLMAIDETVPITASTTLSCTLNDINGDALNAAYLRFAVGQSDSEVVINGSRCSLPTTHLRGDLNVRDSYSQLLFKVDADELNGRQNQKIDIKCNAFVSNSDLIVDSGDLIISNGNITVSDGTINGVVDSLCEYGVNRIGVGTIAFIYWEANQYISLQHGDIIIINDNSNHCYIERLGEGNPFAIYFYFAKGTTSGLSYENTPISLTQNSRYIVMCDTDTYSNTPIFAVVMRINDEE